jgi:hypothetical protein
MRILLFLLLALPLFPADPPSAEIANSHIRARFYLPDPANGFYRGTRFDWSGVIYHLESAGHTFYAPWFTKRSPTVRDFIYEGDDIIAGPCSATAGPADEFRPLGYDTAQPGQTFIKIGVGALRKPDASPYTGYRLYDIADPGKWTVKRHPAAIEFTHTLNGAYVYRKAISLTKGKAELVMRHTLKNESKQPIETTVYNHNFLVLDGTPPGPGAVITVPFAIRSNRPPNPELAEISGNRVVYKKTLTGRETVSAPIEGFTANPADHEIKIENSARKAGMSLHGDRPLQSINLWSIRSNISMEPFIAISVAPGQTFTWTTTYRYYDLP